MGTVVAPKLSRRRRKWWLALELVLIVIFALALAAYLVVGYVAKFFGAFLAGIGQAAAAFATIAPVILDQQHPHVQTALVELNHDRPGEVRLRMTPRAQEEWTDAALADLRRTVEGSLGEPLRVVPLFESFQTMSTESLDQVGSTTEIEWGVEYEKGSANVHTRLIRTADGWLIDDWSVHTSPGTPLPDSASQAIDALQELNARVPILSP